MQRLVDGMEGFERAVAIVNRYVAPHRQTRSFPVSFDVNEQDMENTPRFADLLALFRDGGIIGGERERVILPDMESVEFASGEWLEEYVFHTASSLAPTNVLMGVEAVWDQKGPKPTKNEYDVLFTLNNRLYMIECKTKRFEGPDRVDANDELIYKLESLRDAAGGLYGKGMLVSYRRLTDAQKRRLDANRLAYCDGPNLKDLGERLADWIR